MDESHGWVEDTTLCYWGRREREREEEIDRGGKVMGEWERERDELKVNSKKLKTVFGRSHKFSLKFNFYLIKLRRRAHVKNFLYSLSVTCAISYDYRHFIITQRGEMSSKSEWERKRRKLVRWKIALNYFSIVQERSRYTLKSEMRHNACVYICFFCHQRFLLCCVFDGINSECVLQYLSLADPFKKLYSISTQLSHSTKKNENIESEKILCTQLARLWLIVCRALNNNNTCRVRDAIVTF